MIGESGESTVGGGVYQIQIQRKIKTLVASMLNENRLLKRAHHNGP